MSTDQPYRSAVASALRAEMARRRLASADLASALGCSQSSAARRLSGATSITLDETAVIARWLGIAPSVLLGDAA